MEMSFSTTIWKYAFLALCTFISLAGLIVISCGVVALGGAGSVTGAYIVTSLGCFVMGIAFLGCWGSLRESYVTCVIYLVLTVISIIAHTIFMIAFAIKKDSLMDMTAERINDLWEKEAEQPGAMDNVQFQYYCCGKDSPQDYLLNDDDVLPKSCCALQDCSQDTNIYTKGCAITAVNFIDDQSDYLILTILGLIILKVLGGVAAYYLGQGVKHQVEKMEQIVITE